MDSGALFYVRYRLPLQPVNLIVIVKIDTYQCAVEFHLLQ